METKSENTDMVTLFFNLFNQCLQELTGDSSYTFSPYGFMVNEASVNFNAIQAVFGKEMLPQLLANGISRNVQSTNYHQ